LSLRARRDIETLFGVVIGSASRIDRDFVAQLNPDTRALSEEEIYFENAAVES
jgi:hypothetical protein